eukprot:CAMPEP_0172801756 /NCGR_PEP_ID=MMETSP1075-20121228/3412_1 /TAXON_ID=2916 /ORGANISM="Ceratium fusus, Strain PA161109" /LENGTH=152 /DNA_ID=CAMNT_0013639881 /DNA_START=593 /DNA_END=1049 /DNA_ORIENTATION=+
MVLIVKKAHICTALRNISPEGVCSQTPKWRSFFKLKQLLMEVLVRRPEMRLTGPLKARSRFSIMFGAINLGSFVRSIDFSEFISSGTSLALLRSSESLDRDRLEFVELKLKASTPHAWLARVAAAAKPGEAALPAEKIDSIPYVDLPAAGNK